MSEKTNPIRQDFESNEGPESQDNIISGIGYGLTNGAGLNERLNSIEESQEGLRTDFKELKVNQREDFKDLKVEHRIDSEKTSNNFSKLVTAIISSAVIAVMILIYVLDGDSDNIDKSITHTSDKIEVLSNQLNKRVDRHDGKLDKLDDKLDKLDSKFDDRFDKIIDKLDKK